MLGHPWIHSKILSLDRRRMISAGERTTPLFTVRKNPKKKIDWEEERDEACETTTVAWLAGAAVLAAREKRNQGCFLKLWALPQCCSRMFFFSAVFVDSTLLRNGEHSQICGPHWIPSVEKSCIYAFSLPLLSVIARCFDQLPLYVSFQFYRRVLSSWSSLLTVALFFLQSRCFSRQRAKIFKKVCLFLGRWRPCG